MVEQVRGIRIQVERLCMQLANKTAEIEQLKRENSILRTIINKSEVKPRPVRAINDKNYEDLVPPRTTVVMCQRCGGIGHTASKCTSSVSAGTTAWQCKRCGGFGHDTLHCPTE